MRYCISFTFYFGLLFSQERVLPDENPCDHPLLSLARENGVRAVPLKEYFKYRQIVKACNEQGGQLFIEQIAQRDLIRDYYRSKVMASWTSTHAICVFSVIFYYFLGLGVATK